MYIAAHMPDVGEKESEDGKRFPRRFIQVDCQLFAADLSPEQAAFMARSQVFNFADNFSATITTAAWRTKPSWMLAGGERSHYQPRTGTLVCGTRQEPQI